MSKIELGDIVVSKKGRDVGEHYVVIANLEDKYHIIVNGDTKTFLNPKRKIKKHLTRVSKIDSIKAKLENNSKIFDSEIYSAIKKYQRENSNNNNITNK